MIKTIVLCLTLFLSSVCLAVPVAPQNTGMAGYGMGDSGWIQSVMFDIEFTRPNEVDQFFKQTYFKVEPKPSSSQIIKHVDSGLLSAVDDAFNNKGLLRVNPAAVNEPPLFLLIFILGAGVCFMTFQGGRAKA